MGTYEDRSDHPSASELNHDAYKEGCSYYDAGDFSRAKTSFETALEYWPEDPQAWIALGNSHDSMKQPARAEICYRMALRFVSPEAKSDVYYNLGNSLFDQGKYQAAIECYSEINGQSKAFRAAQRNMELARERLG